MRIECMQDSPKDSQKVILDLMEDNWPLTQIPELASTKRFGGQRFGSV